MISSSILEAFSKNRKNKGAYILSQVVNNLFKTQELRMIFFQRRGGVV